MFVLDRQFTALLESRTATTKKKKKKIQTGQNWTFQADLLSTVQTEKQNMKDSLLVIAGNGLCHLNSWASVWFPQGNLKILRARPLLWHHLVDKTLHALRIKFKTTYQFVCFFPPPEFSACFFSTASKWIQERKDLGGSARYFQFLLTFVFWTVSFPVSPTTVHFNGILHNLSLVARRRQSEAGQGPARQATLSNSWQENVCVRLC